MNAIHRTAMWSCFAVASLAAQTAAPLQGPPAPTGAAFATVPVEDEDGAIAPGLPAVGLDATAVEAAIARGARFLRTDLQADAQGGTRLGYATDHVLMALALVHAGVHRSDADFDRALRTMLQQLEIASLGVYSAGLFCMLVEAYGSPEFYGRLRSAARYLVEGQAESGSWTYAPKVDPALCNDPDRRVLQVTGGTPPRPEAADAAWTRTMPWNAHPSGDNSLSQFALLGLRAAQRCSVPVPEETWRRAAAWFRSGQRPNGAFGYEARGADGYGSMTLAGICGLAIAEHELGNVDFARDAGIRAGLAWMRGHFAIDTNPGSDSFLHYYLYSLERTGRIFGRDVLCGQPWYAVGARQLLATQQPSGGWDRQQGGESPRQATSFALLFLTRSTQQLHVERKRGGSGTLQTFAQLAPGARLYVILDASGSMLEPTPTGTRFELARAAIEAVLSALPAGPQVALRVYGHRKRATDKGADEDTELVVPLGAFDRETFFSRLRSLRARGKTPLARSLRAAADDLAGTAGGRTTVVLLTDGGEDSMPRQDPTVAAAALGKLAGLRLHVVGFDIARPEWQVQLRAMANAGHGDYLPASNADLAAELRAAVVQAPEQYVLHGPDGTELRRGKFGDSVVLPEGQYRLAASFRGQQFATDLWIDTEAVTAVVFDGSQALAVQPAQPGERICPGCRKPVPGEATFCNACGSRLVEGR